MALKDPNSSSLDHTLDHVMPTHAMPVARPPLDDPWSEPADIHSWSRCGKYDLDMPIVDPVPDSVFAMHNMHKIHRYSWPTVVVELAPQYGIIRTPSDHVVRARFEGLRQHWLSETRFSSSVVKICTNEHYLKIIGLGAQVVPLIFERIEADEGHWGWALTSLTGANPAIEADTQKQANSAWLEWRSALSEA